MNSEQKAQMFTFCGWLGIVVFCFALAAFGVLYEGLTLIIFVAAIFAYVGCFLMAGYFVWWMIKQVVKR